MSTYTLATTLDRGYDETVAATREALAEQGFGILTEIDLRATLKEKLDVEVAPQVILGACRPPLAHLAMQADPSVATMLPCNVVVRAVDDARTVVEAFDPEVMPGIAGAEGLEAVAAEARRRLVAALTALDGEPS